VHAWNGCISTFGLKSDVAIVFLDPNFLYDVKILSICIHLKQLSDYLIFTWILRTSWPKMNALGQNRGRGVVSWLTPNELVFTFLGYYVCQFWWKSIKKHDRESAQRRIHWQIDRQTQTNFICHHCHHCNCVCDYLSHSYSIYHGTDY